MSVEFFNQLASESIFVATVLILTFVGTQYYNKIITTEREEARQERINLQATYERELATAREQARQERIELQATYERSIQKILENYTQQISDMRQSFDMAEKRTHDRVDQLLKLAQTILDTQREDNKK